TLQRAAHHAPRMAEHGGLGHARNLVKWDENRLFERVGQGAEARAEDERERRRTVLEAALGKRGGGRNVDGGRHGTPGDRKALSVSTRGARDVRNPSALRT